MKKSNLLRISAILCLLSSYLWIAPSQVHALPAGFQEYYVLGNEEQTYVTGGATADNQMVYYDRWKSGYEAGLRSSVFASGGEYLWSTDPLQTDRLSLSISKGDVPQAPGESNPSAPLRAPTLAVDIVSSPWATVDNNSVPGVGDGELPQVFVVEAVITNTGAITDVVVHLDFNPGNGWMLSDGEDPDRIVEDLAPGTPYHAYWFAQYPHLDTDIGVTHQYTVTVAPVDDPADSVAASATVTTRGTLGPTNQEMTYASAEVVVGVAFTVTVGFDLGKNPEDVVFSPAGNPDFDPGNYRLVASKVRFYNDAEPPSWEQIVPDRLYFPTLDSSARNAEVTYTFLALTPENSRLCPYAGISFGTTSKYDQYYCSESMGTSISIEGEVSLSLTKQASSLTIEQNQLLTYTISYTNTGSQPISYVWIWDDVDTDIGSIITTTIDLPSNPNETTDSRVAWYLGTVPASGQPGSTDTLTFAILIDGDNQYLADNPLLVNHSFLGINPGGLPQNAALISTVTTTIQVPVLTITKSDYPDPVLIGRLITYTLHYTNSGSAAATNVLITDVVPLNTTYQSCSGGSNCGMSNGMVSWNIGTVPSNTNVTVSFSVLVSEALATGTLIRNEDYGIFSDQTGFIPGSLVTTRVSREAAFIDGYAFQDDNGNGLRDAGEVGLSGITVTLPRATVPVITTDGNGYYHFRVEIQEPISVTADLPAGYFRTTPGTVFLESTFGITQTVNFGYASTSSNFAAIYGIVFEDTNGDGVQNLGEAGIQDVTVTLDGSDTTTTNASGYYVFTTTVVGTHTVVETDPDGYFSTTPNTVTLTVALNWHYQVDFGDALTTAPGPGNIYLPVILRNY